MGNHLLTDIGIWISTRPQSAIGVDVTAGASFLRTVSEAAALLMPEIQNRTDAGKPGTKQGFPTKVCIERIGHPAYTLADEANSAYAGRLGLRSVGGAVTTAQQGSTAAYLHSAKLMNALLSRQRPLTTLIEILGGANYRWADMVVDSFRLEQSRAEAPRYSTTLIGSGKFTEPNGADVQQVETAVAVGSVSGSGNAELVVTAAGMPGSPKTILFAVTNGDTAAQWAAKARTALRADPSVAGFFIVSGLTTSIVLTARLAAANDATMNLAYDNDTSTGITTDATSNNTTAGAKTLPETLDTLPCFDGNLTEVFWTDTAGLQTLTSGCQLMGWNAEIGNNTKLNDRCIGDPTVTITDPDTGLVSTPAHVQKMKHGQVAAVGSVTLLLNDTPGMWRRYATGDTLTDVTWRARGPIIESPHRHSLAVIFPKAYIAQKAETEVDGEAALTYTIAPFWDAVTETAVRVEVMNDETGSYD